MRIRPLMLFVPSNHSLIGDLRNSHLNSSFELVFPYESSETDFLGLIPDSDIVVVDVTYINALSVSVIDSAIKNDINLILIHTDYSDVISYRSSNDLITKVKSRCFDL